MRSYIRMLSQKVVVLHLSRRKLFLQSCLTRQRKSDINLAKSNLEKLLEKMPKVSTVADDLRHNRLKSKAATNSIARPSPGKVYISMTGNGSKGNPQCLNVFTDYYSYIFNCGEGTQRLAHEYKIKLVKQEHVFITSKSWANIGGLLGLSLTIKDIGVPEIMLHGPPETLKLYDITRWFSQVKSLNIVPKYPEEKTFSDKCMTVTYAVIHPIKRPTETARCPLDVMQPSAQSDEGSEVNGNKRPKLSIDETPISDMVVAYICKLQSKPGQLLLNKCVEQGVPPGPFLGQLKNGEDVTLKDGRVVKSKDVVSPEDPGPVFIVVECPNENYLDAFLEEESFKMYQNPADDSVGASLVVHFTPPDIIINPKYQEWTKRFNRTTHWIANDQSPSLSSLRVHVTQHKLNFVDANIFPHLNEVLGAVTDGILGTVQAATGLRYHLRPPTGIDRSGIPSLNLEELGKFKEMPGLNEAFEEMREKIQNTQIEEEFDRDYPETVFLGTGSAIPSPARNVSAIIVNISPERSLLLDCGEGTYKQLIRLYGPERAETFLQNLTTIFVSHLHADHHIGLMQLLLEREAIYKRLKKTYPKILLIAPAGIIYYLENYNNMFQPIAHLFKLIPNYLLHHTKRRLNQEDFDALKNELGLKDIATIAVLHCHDAYGITFTTNCNFKIVYSGDTMPSDKLIAGGQNCHLLIHEATMEDDLKDDAILKTHSTTSQAIEVGQKMRARFTILTHFSQRYAKLPIYTPDMESNVGFAFDNMVVRPCDLFKLPLMIPVFRVLFREEYDVMNKRTTKRQLQRELVAKLAS